MPVVPRTQCYCLSYGHDDPCFIYYNRRRFDSGLVPIDGDVSSTALYRTGQTVYWHKFEFVMTLVVTNYAMLTSDQQLYVFLAILEF